MKSLKLRFLGFFQKNFRNIYSTGFQIVFHRVTRVPRKCLRNHLGHGERSYILPPLPYARIAPHLYKVLYIGLQSKLNFKNEFCCSNNWKTIDLVQPLNFREEDIEGQISFIFCPESHYQWPRWSRTLITCLPVQCSFYSKWLYWFPPHCSQDQHGPICTNLRTEI